MSTGRVEDLTRDALFAAKQMGMGKCDFDWVVECVKADSLAWMAMPYKQEDDQHEARMRWIEQGGNVG